MSAVVSRGNGWDGLDGLVAETGAVTMQLRLFSRCATGAFRNSLMRPEDARKDVHFHQFFYRVNADKTIDAICGFCYVTAATADSRADLQLLERAHRCPRQ